MLATAKISVTLGNLRYDSQVSALQVICSLLPAVNTASVLFPGAVNISAAPEAQAEVSIDAGNGAVKVLSGVIQSIEHRPFDTTVVISDSSYALSNYRPNATFEKQNAANIVQTLASDIDVAVANADIDLSIPQYAAHQKRTAAEHIATLAKLSDGFAMINADGELSVKNWPEGSADAAIQYGRDLIDFNFTRHQSTHSVAPIGNGPSGSIDAPDVMRLATSQLPESVPDPGQDVVWQPQLMLRTPAAVQTAQSGLARERNQRAGQAQLVNLLRPDFTPGMTLAIQGIPNSAIADRWILTHVTHEIAPGSHARTIMKARESADAGGLLDALAGALGALL